MKIDREYSDRIRAKSMVILDSLSDCEEFEIIAIAKEIKAQAELSMERVRAVAIRQADEAVHRFQDIFPMQYGSDSNPIPTLEIHGVLPSQNIKPQKHSIEPKCQENWIKEVLADDGDEE